jgi:hypothetical protein
MMDNLNEPSSGASDMKDELELARDSLQQLLLKTQRLQFEDGLTELLLGGFMLLGGFVLLVDTFIPIGGLKIALPALLFISGVLPLGSLHDRVKTNLPSRRIRTASGLPPASPSFWAALGLAIAVLALLALAVIQLIIRIPAYGLAFTPLLMGLFLGIVWWILGIRLKIFRLVIVGALSLFLGGILSPIVLGVESIQGYMGFVLLAVYLALAGLVLLVSGGITLRSYLRS